MTSIKKLTTQAKHTYHLEVAAELARSRSTLRKFATGCVIFDRSGVPVAHGWSHYGERILQRYKHYRSVHAELHALLRTTDRSRLIGGTIYIATIRKRSGNLGVGKPCELCEELIAASGIKTVIYTTGNPGTNWFATKAA